MSLRPNHWAVIIGRNQEGKCLFVQLDRPKTNQSNVVCDVCCAKHSYFQTNSTERTFEEVEKEDGHKRFMPVLYK